MSCFSLVVSVCSLISLVSELTSTVIPQLETWDQCVLQYLSVKKVMFSLIIICGLCQ